MNSVENKILKSKQRTRKNLNILADEIGTCDEMLEMLNIETENQQQKHQLFQLFDYLH